MFGKIYNSLINNRKIEIGSTYYYREILHARYVASEAMMANSTKIIGSGRLIYVNDYIKDLYIQAKLDYNNLVVESEQSWRPNNTFWLNSTDCKYSYIDLLKDSMEDL